MNKTTDIIISNLCFGYGDNSVFKDFSTIIKGGVTTCLTGPSGCGKTTLLRLIMGLEKPDSGTVSVTGRIAAVFQEDRLCLALSARDNVRLVLDKNSDADVGKQLAAVGLGDEAGKAVSEFSGGMKRRVALVRAVACARDCILMDEPFKGLDDETKLAAIDYIKHYANGKTILIVTHDRRDIELLDALHISLGADSAVD